MAGLLKKRNARDEAEIPTASMADIAFLLLVFFLVTTTINVPTGIGMVLPPPLEEEQEPPPVKDRNMLKILVDENGRVLIEEELASIRQVREEVKRNVLNYGQAPDYSVNPDDAVVSIKTAAQTPYNAYIGVLDEVWMAYFEMWDQIVRSGQLPTGETVLNRTYPSYDAYAATLPEGEESENPIREALPANISVAEPPDLQEQQ